ncbi:c-type cytochrome precursor [Rhodopirellula maiorica SM1]|uniref:C-type cytochrome n=1 Tax=Rhodopirellula maiorica SM1 TaxID=1265738 RepID=M5RNX4_9BACT|nr:multiheme c-type cytochrome [Rhodopirellula maiorica]EMI20896.1 c-type cytochrome precursor [Rhodopirellula maiorica SM1]
MQRKWFIVILGIILIPTCVWLLYDNGENQHAQQLIKREKQLEIAEPSQSTQTREFDLAALADRGLGQPLPTEFLSSWVAEDEYWFVGYPRADVGVEIPFPPGKIAKASTNTEPVNENPGFVGPQSCRECHREKFESFIHTAHFQTSRLASPETVHGAFTEGRNEMTTREENVTFEMVQRNDQLYQRVDFYGWRFEVPMQIVFGSAKMGESYLYWHGDQLYQHNVTYLTDPDRWVNSPGYVDGDAAYARPIPARCVECHTTYADFREERNHYTPGSLILGISCERCHGPGREHVAYHQTHPDSREAKAITNPRQLTRQQQLDICGQCHSGTAPRKTTPFAFRPGDRVTDHFDMSKAHLDDNRVHTSNQLNRLSQSKCFQESEMTCADCHNPHQSERGNMRLFSQRCIQCHDAQACGMAEQIGERIVENCIDCHMPLRNTKKLRFETAAGKLFPPLRDHHVRVDELATEAYLKSIDPAPAVRK